MRNLIKFARETTWVRSWAIFFFILSMSIREANQVERINDVETEWISFSLNRRLRIQT